MPGFAVMSSVVVAFVFVRVLSLLLLGLLMVILNGYFLSELFSGEMGLFFVVDFYHFVIVELAETSQFAVLWFILHLHSDSK